MSENQNENSKPAPTSLTMHGTAVCVACTSVGSALNRSGIEFDKVVYEDKDDPDLLKLKDRLDVAHDDMLQFPVMQAHFADGTDKLMRMRNTGEMLELVKQVRKLYATS